MNTRNLMLAEAYIGAPLTLGGRELCLSIGRYSLLEYWKNPFFYTARNKRPQKINDVTSAPTGHGSFPDLPCERGISEVAAMGELIMTCWASKETLADMRRATPEARADLVLEFMLTYEDELGDVAQGIMDRMKSIEAAGVVSIEPGKQEA